VLDRAGAHDPDSPAHFRAERSRDVGQPGAQRAIVGIGAAARSRPHCRDVVVSLPGRKRGFALPRLALAVGDVKLAVRAIDRDRGRTTTRRIAPAASAVVADVKDGDRIAAPQRTRKAGRRRARARFGGGPDASSRGRRGCARAAPSWLRTDVESRRCSSVVAVATNRSRAFGRQCVRTRPTESRHREGSARRIDDASWPQGCNVDVRRSALGDERGTRRRVRTAARSVAFRPQAR